MGNSISQDDLQSRLEIMNAGSLDRPRWVCQVDSVGEFQLNPLLRSRFFNREILEVVLRYFRQLAKLEEGVAVSEQLWQ